MHKEEEDWLASFCRSSTGAYDIIRYFSHLFKSLLSRDAPTSLDKERQSGTNFSGSPCVSSHLLLQLAQLLPINVALLFTSPTLVSEKIDFLDHNTPPLKRPSTFRTSPPSTQSSTCFTSPSSSSSWPWWRPLLPLQLTHIQNVHSWQRIQVTTQLLYAIS